MDDRRAQQGPALGGFFDMACDLPLRHAGIMFERQRLQIVVAAHDANETCYATDVHLPIRQCLDLVVEVEVFLLNADMRFHPPVTGGKNATSSLSEIAASKLTCCWLTAARSRDVSPNASRKPPPRFCKCSTRSRTVLTLGGSSMVSCAAPTFCRTQAK